MLRTRVLSAGEWLRPYVRIERLVADEPLHTTYEVLYGDAVPKPALLRRYRVDVWPIDLLRIAREASVYDLSALGDGDEPHCFDVIASEPSLARFQELFSNALAPLGGA